MSVSFLKRVTVRSYIVWPDRKRGPDALRDEASNDALCQFVVHLVLDLRVPLQALDDKQQRDMCTRRC
jgi:hypothetical protein